MLGFVCSFELRMMEVRSEGGYWCEIEDGGDRCRWTLGRMGGGTPMRNERYEDQGQRHSNASRQGLGQNMAFWGFGQG